MKIINYIIEREREREREGEQNPVSNQIWNYSFC
jgi:hypothetical protein